MLDVNVHERRTLKLGRRVKVWRVLPYRVPGRPECFVVDWPSYWDDELDIEVGVVAVRKRSGRWKVIELELPKGISDEDAEDIVLCYWYVFDKDDRRRKCPPLIMAWEFSSPPVWVAACERPTQEKQAPFARRLKEMKEPPPVSWSGPDFIDELRCRS